jgi:hypothetical protein
VVLPSFQNRLTQVKRVIFNGRSDGKMLKAFKILVNGGINEHLHVLI